MWGWGRFLSLGWAGWEQEEEELSRAARPIWK